MKRYVTNWAAGVSAPEMSTALRATGILSADVRTGFSVIAGNGQRNALTLSVHAQNDKLTRLRFACNTRGASISISVTVGFRDRLCRILYIDIPLALFAKADLSEFRLETLKSALGSFKRNTS